MLILADVHDLAYEEIATILEIPTGTVKSRLHRGRAALGRAMGLEAGPDREPGRASGASEEGP